MKDSNGTSVGTIRQENGAGGFLTVKLDAGVSIEIRWQDPDTKAYEYRTVVGDGSTVYDLGSKINDVWLSLSAAPKLDIKNGSADDIEEIALQAGQLNLATGSNLGLVKPEIPGTDLLDDLYTTGGIEYKPSKEEEKKPPEPSGPSGPSDPGGRTYTDSTLRDNPTPAGVLIPDNQVPLASAPLTSIEDGEVPLAALPKTGGKSAKSSLSLIGSLLALAGGLILKSKEKNDEEE